MSAKYFLDTNVFIYSVDDADRAKQKTARDLIRRARRDNLGTVSWQVVQEFCNVATRKIARPMTMADCRDFLEKSFKPLRNVHPRLAVYSDALQLQEETGFAFYDSLTIAAALEGGCTELHTEDLQHGQKVRTLTIVNPFL